jgi:hypothetical protein
MRIGRGVMDMPLHADRQMDGNSRVQRLHQNPGAMVGPAHRHPSHLGHLH